MSLTKWTEEGLDNSKLNDNFNTTLRTSGINLINQLVDRSAKVPADGGIFSEAYVDTTGRLNSVDTVNTTASFSGNGYFAPEDAEYLIYHDILSGTFKSTINSTFGTFLTQIGNDVFTLNLDYGQEKSISAATNPRGALFNDDGTRLLISDPGSDSVKIYSLSKSYDLSTLAYSSSFSISTTYADNLGGMSWNDDGTEFYISGTVASNARVAQYTCSTPYDLTSGSYTAYESFSEDLAAWGVSFNATGSKVYLVGYDETIYQYTLSTPFDITTSSYDSVSLSVPTADYGMFITPTGNKIFVWEESTTPRITEVTMSTPYDLSTGSITNTLETGNQYGDAITFNPSGTMMFQNHRDTAVMRQYDIAFWEIGADVKYKLTGTAGAEDSGWLDSNEISEFTAFTAEPDTLIIKLVPKTSSPTAGLPNIKGITLYGTKP